jgi:hypothetical protein
MIRKRALFMVDAWELLGDMFGGTWENAYGDAKGRAIGTWTRALSCFSETQVRAAVALCRDWQKPFPPTLGEFCELCRSFRRPVAPDHLITHDRRAPKAVANHWLAKMRAITRGEYDESRDGSEENTR